MPEKLARSVVVTPCCRHHSLTERPLLRHSWICAAHSCSSARCFNSALVILTSHNTTVAKPFATFRYYCLMCVYARLGLTVTVCLSVKPNDPQQQIICLEADRKYSIPAFQREVRWDDNNLKMLLYDLSRSSKFLGNIILTIKSDHTCEIIDGQQRTTVLMAGGSGQVS